jgi:hypothetical protein
MVHGEVMAPNRVLLNGSTLVFADGHGSLYRALILALLAAQFDVILKIVFEYCHCGRSHGRSAGQNMPQTSK